MRRINRSAPSHWRCGEKPLKRIFLVLSRPLKRFLRKRDAGRIVNLSSILGSMTHHSTPGSPIYGYHVPADNVSKAAVNAFTMQLAYELKDTKIKVNAAHPGWVKPNSAAKGRRWKSKTAPRRASRWRRSASGSNGAYLHMGKPLPW
jgi:NAD(P)-dependent dehydrogenase (short-subunit alcohol dehydrogenase family)